MFCVYNVTGATPNLVFRKDGVRIETGILPNQGVGIPVPNGDYTPSVEGTYTCSVTINGQSRGTRDTIVSLPGKFCMQHVCVSHAQSGSV